MPQSGNLIQKKKNSICFFLFFFSKLNILSHVWNFPFKNKISRIKELLLPSVQLFQIKNFLTKQCTVQFSHDLKMYYHSTSWNSTTKHYKQIYRNALLKQEKYFWPTFRTQICHVPFVLGRFCNRVAAGSERSLRHAQRKAFLYFPDKPWLSLSLSLSLSFSLSLFADNESPEKVRFLVILFLSVRSVSERGRWKFVESIRNLFSTRGDRCRPRSLPLRRVHLLLAPRASTFRPSSDFSTIARGINRLSRRASRPVVTDAAGRNGEGKREGESVRWEERSELLNGDPNHLRSIANSLRWLIARCETRIFCTAYLFIQRGERKKKKENEKINDDRVNAKETILWESVCERGRISLFQHCDYRDD